MRLFILSLVLFAGCSAGDPSVVPLFDGLGDHHHPISTESAEAQAYFDQGMRLTYGFNHQEAIRSFEQAIAFDSTCGMCYWGIAFAAGPNINATMDEPGGDIAFNAMRQALLLSHLVDERDGEYIIALARRYGADVMADRAERDASYAEAMADLASMYPDDDDAQVLYADALMNLRPWDYWTESGEPRENTPELLAALERVAERNPEHAGACHLYIHAVEKVEPERAIPCAEQLPELMPSAGHIVHMPAHIFIRVGRYEDAIEHNHAATHADERYIHAESPRGLYPLAYYPHNYDFLAFAAAMAGHKEEALEAARNGAAAVDQEMMDVPELGGLHNYLLLPLRMMVRFGMWEEILTEPEPESDLDFVRGFYHFARGTALARTGDPNRALNELTGVKDRIDRPTIEGYYIWWNPSQTILQIGALALEAEIHNARGDVDNAVALLKEAIELETGLVYDEPPPWSVPNRQLLGRIYIEQERFVDADKTFRADLKQYPENGWSLFGLSKALAEQGEAAEAEQIADRFEAAWSGADVAGVAGSY